MSHGDTSGYVKLKVLIRAHPIEAVRHSSDRRSNPRPPKVRNRRRNRSTTPGPSRQVNGTWGRSTLLHHAAKYGCLQCTKLLLEAGAERTQTNGRGKNPQKISREHGHDNLSLLIEFWDMPQWREAGGKGVDVNL